MNKLDALVELYLMTKKLNSVLLANTSDPRITVISVANTYFFIFCHFHDLINMEIPGRDDHYINVMIDGFFIYLMMELTEV